MSTIQNYFVYTAMGLKQKINDIPLKSVAIYIPTRASQKPSPKHETINQKNQRSP